jgi:nucleolin
VKDYNVAFVTNIPWEANKQTIEEVFSSFAPKFVRMFEDSATGKHKGFAHIHFSDEESVDKYALHGPGCSVPAC